MVGFKIVCRVLVFFLSKREPNRKANKRKRKSKTPERFSGLAPDFAQSSLRLTVPSPRKAKKPRRSIHKGTASQGSVLVKKQGPTKPSPGAMKVEAQQTEFIGNDEIIGDPGKGLVGELNPENVGTRYSEFSARYCSEKKIEWFISINLWLNHFMWSTTEGPRKVGSVKMVLFRFHCLIEFLYFWIFLFSLGSAVRGLWSTIIQIRRWNTNWIMRSTYKIKNTNASDHGNFFAICVSI